MKVLPVVFLALLQGVLEWLPISSEGQVILAAINVLDLTPEEGLSLAFFLHLGTMLVVLVRFRDDFQQIILLHDKQLLRLLFLATIGTTITAIPCYFIIKESWTQFSENFSISPGDFVTILVGFFLIITGLILHYQKEEGLRIFEEITDKEVILLGMAQGIAALPGISRSGMTISVLLYLSLSQSESLRGSFLVSVPAVCGAIVLEFITENLISLPINIIIIALGVTFIVGFISMESLIRTSKYLPFDRFCVILGIIAIFLGGTGLLYGFMFA